MEVDAEDIEKIDHGLLPFWLRVVGYGFLLVGVLATSFVLYLAVMGVGFHFLVLILWLASSIVAALVFFALALIIERLNILIRLQVGAPGWAALFRKRD